MGNEKNPLNKHFFYISTYPKWKMKLLITILVFIALSIVSTATLSTNELFEGTGITGEEREQFAIFGKMIGAIGGILGSLIGMGIGFVIVLLIFKVMKSQSTSKSIFSAVISYFFITSVIQLVVLVIQWIAGLSISEYSITSLNIFDKGNQILGVFDVQIIIGAYIFGIMLYETGGISKKASISWSIAYIIIYIIFGLLISNLK